jgi:hypothetical protein
MFVLFLMLTAQTTPFALFTHHSSVIPIVQYYADVILIRIKKRQRSNSSAMQRNYLFFKTFKSTFRLVRITYVKKNFNITR